MSKSGTSISGVSCQRELGGVKDIVVSPAELEETSRIKTIII
jgi:hypothetical protein